MKMVMDKALVDSLKVMLTFPLEIVKAGFMLGLFYFLYIASGLLPILLLFYIIVGLNLWTYYMPYIFLVVFVISYLVVLYFLSGVSAAFGRLMIDLEKNRIKFSLFRFIELTSHYASRMFIFEILKAFILLIVLLPIIGVLVILNMFEMSLIFIPLLYLGIWAITLFIPCSLVMEDVHLMVAIKNGLGMIRKKPVDWILLIFMFTIIGVIFLVIPVVNVLLYMFVFLPLLWITTCLTYHSGR